MSKIRVTYSGLIAFGINLISVFTGLVFTLIVTRTLTPEEFGTWSLISGLMVYALILNPIINYWVTREIARGEKSGKTGIISSGSFSLVGISIYVIIAYFVGIQSDADENLLLFGAILIPIIFLNNTLGEINKGWKPHTVSYGFIAFEISKIVFAIILVYYLDYGIYGAILATFFSYLPSIIILTIFAKPKIKDSFNFKYVKKWIKFFWIPTYRQVPSLLSLSDVLVFSVVTGSVVGVAYYSAARTIGFLVNHTRVLSRGLYPKLLETGKQEFLQENLKSFFYFSFLIVGLSIGIAEAGLFALNPIYTIGVNIVIILSVRSLFTSVNFIFFQALQGIEKIDLNENATFKDYLKSKLMLFPTFQLIRNTIYFISLAIMFYLLGDVTESEIDLVTYWALIGLVIEIPLSFYIYKLVRKEFTIKVEVFTIFKYLIVSIFSFGIMYLLIQKFLEFENKIVIFLPNLLVFMIIGCSIYIGITYLTDNRTKNLVNTIIKEVMNGKKKGD